MSAVLATWHIPTARAMARHAVRRYRQRYEEAYSDALYGLAKALRADRGEIAGGFMRFEILHGIRSRTRARVRNEGVPLESYHSPAVPGADAEAMRGELWRMVDALPDSERRAVRLHYQHAMTQSEIAPVLGVSQMQVSRILARAREQLAETVSG